jgi:hypothetical protein
MAKLTRAHFDKTLQEFAKGDPELHKEIVRKLDTGLDKRVAAATKSLDIAEESPLALDAGPPTVEGERILETIVRSQGRPVLTIRNNRATTEFLGPESEVWAQRIKAATSILDRVIPAVGRVEVTNHPNFLWLGTGWLVADDVMVTNRHVAVEFARRGNAGFSFRMGLNGAPISSRIDFLEEHLGTTSLEYAVESILWIAKSDDPDVAFLRVRRRPRARPLPKFLALAAKIPDADFVATIGYPARDTRVPDQELVKRIFGDVYDKKRLAPGQLVDIADDELQHDCSTLGGNSGSALVSLRTGDVVGLHFAGLFMKANFAVPAPVVGDLLRRVQKGELPGAASITTGDSSPQPAPPTPAPAYSGGVLQQPSPGSYTFRLQVPIEVTVKIGDATLPMSAALPVTAPTAGNLDEALRVARQALAGQPNVLEVRAGYRFKGGWITDERVIVVEVREKLSLGALRSSGIPTIAREFAGVGVDVRTAAFADQLERLGIDVAALEAPPSPGAYREPPNLRLEAIDERVKAIFHVSPDSALPNLRGFLGRVKRRLTATMYEWESEHISDAIKAAMAPANNSLRMVTQRAGTKEAVEDMQTALGNKFRHVWASVGAGKLIPRAYHIKVASRDGEEFWLSSGNWKDSNQPDIHPAAGTSTAITPLRKHNREWHAIIQNDKLAKLFQEYIEFDFREAERVPIDEMPELALPDLFVPDAAFLEGVELEGLGQYFDPLEVDRKLEIQPLLTPDRDSRGVRMFMKHALRMIKKGTEHIYVENQSFNLLDENVDAFEEFLGVLRDKQDDGVDVRIILRDGREFGGDSGVKQQKLLERLQDFGFDMDFMKVQLRRHTKAIMVDSKEVLFGSHNLTNEGSLFNRDASLLVRDPEVTRYFEQIFLFDWEFLARQEVDELVGGMSVAPPGDPTPQGFRRMNLRELLMEG